VRNLEIKSNVSSFRAIRARLRALDGADRQPVVRQTDWYFRVPRGRLKLRVIGRRRGGELIVYRRPDRTGPRTSDFQRMPVADAAGATRLFAETLGLRACVRKRREVWLYRNARVHLDTVAGLGRFIEIEVVVTSGMLQARRLMAELREVLGLKSTGLIGGSYGEMLTRR